jgi:excisionase family DNA binding protein
MTHSPPKSTMTVQQASVLLGCSTQTVRRLIHRGTLTAWKPLDTATGPFLLSAPQVWEYREHTKAPQ